jgi:FtsP/CotA-like multicopper oxidase with cupredoxin domain
MRRLVAALIISSTAVISGACSESTSSGGAYRPRTRTYHIAAQAEDWNYAPLGHDPVFDQDVPSPWGDSLVYPKLRYVAYSNAEFTTALPQPEHRGILGPEIRAVVGDTLQVEFFNQTDRPLSMHPHGVVYTLENEGAQYFPYRGGGDRVPPGFKYTYTWMVDDKSGPSPGEPSSRVWLYHSHVMAEEEIYAGLIGTIVVTDPRHARDDATPDDIDQEFTTLWMVFDENSEGTPEDEEEPNLKHAINGRFFGNLTGLTMYLNQRVRWYLVALGSEVDLHTPHWHGEKVLLEGRTYTDVVELLPASMKTADMIADNPGVWLLHCHVADHMIAGMFTTFLINSTSGPVNMTPRTNDEGWFGFGRSLPAPTHPYTVHGPH